jgi:hypothetical protein
MKEDEEEVRVEEEVAAHRLEEDTKVLSLAPPLVLCMLSHLDPKRAYILPLPLVRLRILKMVLLNL